MPVSKRLQCLGHKGSRPTMAQGLQLSITLLLAVCNRASGGDQPTWRTARIGGGGRVTGILMHAKSPYNTYIRTDVGGAYRFNSSGSSWVQLLDWIPRQQATWYGVESLAVHPARPSSLYAALGEYADDEDEISGAIMMSNDAGATFTTLLAPQPFKPPPNYEVRMGSNQQLRWCGERLAVNAAMTPVLLFGSRRNGLWRSPDGGKTWAQVQDPTLKDALNRGTDFWDGTDSNDPEPVGITSVLFHHKNPKLAFAAVYNQGVFRSMDAGVSWEALRCSSTTCSSPAGTFPANISAATNPQGLAPGSRGVSAAGAVLPLRVCRLALTPKTNTLLATARDQGLFQLPNAGDVQASTAVWQDITPRAQADPGSKFCAVDAVALPRAAAGSLVMERLGVATCEVEDDEHGTRQLCQVFVAETNVSDAGAGARLRGVAKPKAQSVAVEWRQQRQLGRAVDAAWWDEYMLAGPFNTGLLLSRKPGTAANQIWLTNNFGVLQGTVSSSSKSKKTVFKQMTRGLEEVCAFDVKVLPNSEAAGGNVLSAVADVDGFTHMGGAMASAPVQWCSADRGSLQECAYFQETHSLAYCYSDPSVVARVGHVYWTAQSSSGLAVSTDGGATWPKSGMHNLSSWVNTVRDGLLVGAPYRVAISATDCRNMLVLVSSGEAGTVLSNLVTVDGGASFQHVQGLPVAPRRRWDRDQPLVADTVAPGMFYFFDGSKGQLLYSKDQGRSFSPAHSTLRAPMEVWEYVTIKARPGVQGELWVGYPWDNGTGCLFRITGVGTAQEKMTRLPGITEVATFAFGAPLTSAAAHSSTAAAQDGVLEAGAATAAAVQGASVDLAADVSNADAAVSSSVPALYIIGAVAQGGVPHDGIWVSEDLGHSWLLYVDPAKNVTVGKSPVAMDASLNVPGKVVIGTNGRGIWFSS